MKRIVANLLIAVGMISLMTGCANTYFVTGTLTGLPAGGTLTLQNNGADTTVVTADGTFSMNTGVVDNLSYNVTIVGQPNGGFCTVTGGIGTISGANANLSIDCVSIPGPSFEIGGTIAAGSLNFTDLAPGLVLSNSGVEVLDVNPVDPILAADLPASFAFTTGLPNGSFYDVSILTQPAGQFCTIDPFTNFGTVGGGPVSDIAITCVDTNTVGGSVTGLASGNQVVLRINGGDEVLLTGPSVPATQSFVMPVEIPEGSTYAVTVFSDGTQTCTVTNGSGTMGTANVTNVTVTCV